MVSVNPYEGKKLLVLAGQDVHRKLVEAAQEMGVYTIVADYLEDSSAKLIADESSLASIIDVDAIVALCKDRCVDGIANFCNDLAPAVVQQVSAQMGYPNIGTPEQVAVLSDKNLFKQACIDNGIDIVPEYTEADVAADAVEYPVMVKPSDSRGSRGSALCTNKDELLSTIALAKAESTTGEVLIEKSMKGHQELSITYLVIEDEPYLISVGDRHSGRPEDGVDRILSVMMQPSWFMPTYLANVNERVKNMIRNLGIRNSAVFMQGFVDGNTVRMFDPGMRFPGNEYERALAKATAANPMRSVVSYALGAGMAGFEDAYEDCYDLNGLCAVQYMVNARPGTIAAFEGIKAIEAHPNTVYVGWKYEEGDTIPPAGDTRRRVFDITFLVERNVKAVKEVIALVNDNVRILDETGSDMVVSRFDFDAVRSRYDWGRE